MSKKRAVLVSAALSQYTRVTYRRQSSDTVTTIAEVALLRSAKMHYKLIYNLCAVSMEVLNSLETVTKVSYAKQMHSSRPFQLMTGF